MEISKLELALERILKCPENLTQYESNKLIGMYRSLREAKTEISREAEARVRPIKDVMGRIEGFLMDRLNRDGVSSVNTEDGKAIRKTNTYVRVQDWGAFLTWARENGKFSMLKRDVAKSELLAYMDEFDEVPPGIDVTQEEVLQIRK